MHPPQHASVSTFDIDFRSCSTAHYYEQSTQLTTDSARLLPLWHFGRSELLSLTSMWLFQVASASPIGPITLTLTISYSCSWKSFFFFPAIYACLLACKMVPGHHRLKFGRFKFHALLRHFIKSPGHCMSEVSPLELVHQCGHFRIVEWCKNIP